MRGRKNDTQTIKGVLMKKMVIFDMDGVIFDSETAMFAEWKLTAAKYGLKDIEIPYPDCIGATESRSREIFTAFYGPDFPYEKYSRETNANFHKKYDNGRLPLKRGVKELLSYLKENGYLTAIASSSRTDTVKRETADAGLSSFIDKIVGGDMVGKSKPEPDIFLKAAEGSEVPVSSIYVVEDSFNGIKAAAKAGMIPIMVPDMLQPNREIEQLAAYIVDDLLQVKRILFEKDQR